MTIKPWKQILSVSSCGCQMVYKKQSVGECHTDVKTHDGIMFKQRLEQTKPITIMLSGVNLWRSVNEMFFPLLYSVSHIIFVFYLIIHVWMFILLPQLRRRWSKCYIKTSLSWYANLVHRKPPSMEKKKGGADRQGFFPALPLSAVLSVCLGLTDSWNKVSKHEARVTLVIPTWFLEIWP